MSVADPRAGLSLLFNEQADSLSPSDNTGNLSDFDPGALTGTPGVASDGVTGFARVFSSDTSDAIFSDDPLDAIKSSRDLSIVALLEFDVVAQNIYGQPGMLIHRNEEGGGPTDWELRLTVTDPVTSMVKMHLSWEDVLNVAVDDTGVEFTWFAGETYLIAAVREVVDGALQCRYFVNGESAIGGTNLLDCANSVVGEVWVGYDPVDANEHINATIEALEVYTEPITTEELNWLWLNMTVDRPDGAAAIKALVPPDVYSTNEDSSIQRELAVQGVGVGVLRGSARRLRDNIWPSGAWGVALQRHESSLGLPQTPGDSIEVRRTRVSDAYGAVLGFSVPDVKTQLEESFDLDSADIEILEFDNTFSPDFNTDEDDYVGDVGSMSRAIAAGALVFTGAASDADFGTYLSLAGWTVWPVASEVDAWISGVIEIATSGTGAGEAMGCLMVGSRKNDEWLLFGRAGDNLVRYATFLAGSLSAWTTIETSSNEFFRVRCLGEGQFELRVAATTSLADAATPTIVSGPQDASWAGVTATSYGAAGSEMTGTVTLSKFLIHAPGGPQRFNWYAYRDPALPGNPDMIGANLVVNRIKPAHTFAAAITEQSVLCDDLTRGCDREPIGK